MDADRERKHLEEADRHIANAKATIEQQKKIIEKLIQEKHGTKVAVSLLHAMEHSLQAFEQHRKTILELLDTLEALEKNGGSVR